MRPEILVSHGEGGRNLHALARARAVLPARACQAQFAGAFRLSVCVCVCLQALDGHQEAVLALAVGDTFLVSGSYDTTVRFWSLDGLRCIRCHLAPSTLANLQVSSAQVLHQSVGRPLGWAARASAAGGG